MGGLSSEGRAAGGKGTEDTKKRVRKGQEEVGRSGDMESARASHVGRCSEVFMECQLGGGQREIMEDHPNPWHTA